MSFYYALVKQFGYNAPFMTKEIKYKNYSQPWIYKEIVKLRSEGKIIRFEKGVYYIPTKTILGQSKLNPMLVVEKKYLKNSGEIVGYLSGTSFLNSIGISNQVPSTFEIYTNNETSQVREVSVGKQKIILRKSRTKVTSDNVFVLSFLEMMNSVTPAFFNEERTAAIKKYIKTNGITRQNITKYAKDYPDKVMRNLIESEIIYEFA